MQEFTYDVFFSYRHRPLDSELTQKAFNLLESYRLPKAIREQGFPEVHRAFRDTEELPVSRILTESISVLSMHETAAALRKEDGLFFAAVREA